MHNSVVGFGEHTTGIAGIVTKLTNRLGLLVVKWLAAFAALDAD